MKIKKVLSVILFSFTAVCTAVNGAEYSRDDIIYEGFENTLGGFMESGANITYTDGVIGKALKVNDNFSYNTVKLESKIGLSRKYRLSFYVKGIENFEGKELTMLVQRVGKHTNSLGEDAVKPFWRTYHYLNSEPLTNEWQKVSIVFEDINQEITDEVGNCVFFPVVYYENKQNEATPGKNDATTYAIDEFMVEPLDIIENGDFAWAGIGKFTKTKGMSVNVTDENGNNRLVMNCFGDSTAERSISYFPNIEEGKKYRLSFRAKTAIGKNILKTKFSRVDENFPEGQTMGTSYQSLDDAELTNEWKTFNMEFLAPSETAVGIAYRYPELIFNVENAGTVYLDDIYIDKLNDDIYDIKASGEAIPYETVNVSFSDLKSGNGYEWRIIEPETKKVISNGQTDEKSFSFIMPDYEKIALVIRRVNTDNTYSNSRILEIDGIEDSKLKITDTVSSQEIGVAFTDTVWAPDFETVRAYIKVKNKTTECSGFLAMYDEEGRLLRVKTDFLNEGINEFELPAVNGKCAKIFVFDKNNKPLIISEKLELDTKSEFIYVDSAGKVTKNGTFSEPTKLSAAYAKIKARNIPDDKNVYIMIKDTKTPYTTPINISSNSRKGNITYLGYGSKAGEKTVLSGGENVTEWELFDNEAGIYRAKVTSANVTNFRQIYVNGNRAIRARSESIPKMLEITENGYTFYDSYMPMLSNPENAEFVYHYQWTNPRCGIESITNNQDGTVSVDMDDYCWKLLVNKAHLVPQYGPAYIENAIELLDSPGEWFYDREEKYLYYMPRSFEDMDEVEVIVPVQENLVTVTGTAQAKVLNIDFKNIEFAYSNWLYPDTYGYSDAQSGRIRDGYDQLPGSAVTVKYADNVNFTDCRFINLGMTGLIMTEGITNCEISGNEFVNLAGSGMYAGNARDNESISSGITIENNYIHDIGLDYKSCVGIATLWQKDTDVIHNEIFDVPYSAVHGGYGASTDITNLNYNYNFIHRSLNAEVYDGGSLYHTQKTGGTEENPNYMKGNYIKEQLKDPGVLYPDNGATGWMLCDNVIDLSMVDEWRYGTPQWMLANPGEDNWANNNYTTTDKYVVNNDLLTDAENDPGIIVSNTKVYPDANWPEEARKIIKNSGLSEKYSALLAPKYQIIKATEKELRIMSGMKKTLDFYGEGGKDGVFEKTEELYIINNSPDILELDGYEITGKNSGKGSITVYSYSGNILKKLDIPIEIYR